MKSKKLVFGQIDLNMCRDFDLVQALDYDFKEKKLYNKGRGLPLCGNIQNLTFAIPLRRIFLKNINKI
ncbi:hypothetical protein [Streptococcus equi]|uniref:hypothetical protein n=1 Tax=Streptococcus equi TaxID=1336 RepID=UPI001E3C3920|nr:hypothetical protein [Streptococcus equi]